MHGSKRIKSLVLAVTFAGTMGITSYGSSPEFARSAEEWARLRDDVLEYEELEDLIHEYNAVVQNNQYEYRKFREDYGVTNDEVSAAYRDLADDLYGEISGDSEAGSMIADLQLEIQAENMLKQADNTLEDSRIYLLTYEQAEKNLAAAAQSNMISFYRLGLQLEEQQLQLSLAQKQYQLVQVQLANGLATELDLLTAREQVETLESQIAETERARDRIRENLQVSVGWKHNDTPVIGELPLVDESQIISMNPEADLEQAVRNNYVLQANRQRLENTGNALTRENLEETIRNNEKTIATSLSSAYADVISKNSAYDQAVSQAAYESENLRIAGEKWQAGMITATELQQQQNQTEISQLETSIASLDLLESMETYQWSVKGLATTE